MYRAAAGDGHSPSGEVRAAAAASGVGVCQQKPTESSGRAGSARSNPYASASVTPKDAVMRTHDVHRRSRSEATAAVKNAKNTRSLQPIWATP